MDGQVCVLWVSMLPFSTILVIDFIIVPTVWYVLVFHFIMQFDVENQHNQLLFKRFFKLSNSVMSYQGHPF